jgi:hypothetical protein
MNEEPVRRRQYYGDLYGSQSPSTIP